MAGLTKEQKKQKDYYKKVREEKIKYQLARYEEKKAELQEYQRNYEYVKYHTASIVTINLDKNGKVLKTDTKQIK